VVLTELHCGFCHKYHDHDQVTQLIAGPKIGICDKCIVRCDELFSEAGDTDEGGVGAFTDSGPFIPEPISKSWKDFGEPRKAGTTPYCSYCRGEIHYAIHKGDVIICDECTDLCMDILIEKGQPVTRKAPHRAEKRFARLRFPF